LKQHLVTGGAGFIGSHIVERLVAEGNKVRVLDNLSSGRFRNLQAVEGKIEFVEGDIRDWSAVQKAVRGVDFVLHQAALRSVPKSMELPREYNEVNVNGTVNVLRGASEAGAQKVVFASSSSIYGTCEVFPQREDYPVHVISPYALTKKIGEEYCRLFSEVYSLPTVCLRYFNVFGPRQSLDDDYAVVVPKFITCLLKKESPPVYGDGLQSRDFTFVSNVVDANLAALRGDLGGGEVVNVACGEPKTVLSLAEVITKNISSNGVRPRFLPPRAGDVRKTHADVTRLKKLLGLAPRVSFEKGLQATIDWFRAQV